MKTLKFFVLVAVSASLIINLHTPLVQAAPAVELKLSILPMECVVEQIDDGITTVRRVTPAACKKVVHEDAKADFR